MPKLLVPFIFATTILISCLGQATFSFAQAEDTQENRLALARQIIEQTVTAEILDKMIDSTWPVLEQRLQSKNSSIDPDILAVLKSDMSRQLHETIDDIAKDMPSIYADLFTATELQALVDFLTSDVGRKLAAKQPELMGRIMPKMIGSLQDRMPSIMRRLLESARQKGLQI